jgi:catechol 2,3-dioxygenase-like lactoylglutathione lyase family enzyme
MIVERISAVTLKVTNMARSVRFYNEILRLEVIYGGPDSSFTSLRTAGAQDAILNLEQGASSSGWGRLIFYVKDVDQVWAHLKARGLDAPQPRNASWGERYFHMQDPDGHELSFAKPLP